MLCTISKSVLPTRGMGACTAELNMAASRRELLTKRCFAPLNGTFSPTRPRLCGAVESDQM